MYGVIPLGLKCDDTFEFLVFGGDSFLGFNKRTCIFTTNLNTFSASTFTVIEDMIIPDQFYDSLYFPLPTPLSPDFIAEYVPESKRPLLCDLTRPHPNLVGTVSQTAFHIFDVNSRVWIASVPALGWDRFTS